jgi:hypothetical protein
MSDKRLIDGDKPLKKWWAGDPRVEKYMGPVDEAISRHLEKGPARTDIYNRAYEAVYNAIKDVSPSNQGEALNQERYDTTRMIIEGLNTWHEHKLLILSVINRAVHLEREVQRLDITLHTHKSYDKTVTELYEEAARLREALNKIGFYCAGTEFDHVSKFVLKALSSHTEDKPKGSPKTCAVCLGEPYAQWHSCGADDAIRPLTEDTGKCPVCKTDLTGLCVVDDHLIPGVNTKG